MYKLTITKYTPNPNYEEELKAVCNPYSTKPQPQREITGRTLEVELTDEEFAKMKKEVLTVFE